MKKQNFTTTILVDQSPEEAFNAINNVRGWWSGEIDGDADKLGAEFTYCYKDVHRTKQKITEFISGKKVVWHVLEATLALSKTKTNGVARTSFLLSEKNRAKQKSVLHMRV
jgi:hypothetical protein